MHESPTRRHVRTNTLEIAYEESGSSSGKPVILLHGFPYDPRTYDDMFAGLVSAGCRVIVPYLRGYGPTAFLSQTTLRSGQQAALAKDLLDLLDALGLTRAALVGYDWGGRAACIVAALWPERVQCLVSAGGYNIQDIAAAVKPASAEQEHRYWYQYYFHTERGRAGLQANRRDICRLLWRLWSPNWPFDEATFERTAVSFDNPDFVEVVIHSYRHRFAYVAGDPAYEAIEQQLAQQPPITVPTIVLHGAASGVSPADGSAAHVRYFTGPYQRRVIPMVGHNIPAEAPQAMQDAVLELMSATPA
jgi:pimeloyl-ACP methyl ester carboxylesterase